MDRERISRLINFDEEDTSTGYVTVGGKTSVWRRNPKKEKEIIKQAKEVYMRDGYDQIVFVDNDGDYTISRLNTGWYDDNSWNCMKVIAVLGPGYGGQPSIYRAFKNEIMDYGLWVMLKCKGFPEDAIKELTFLPDGQ